MAVGGPKTCFGVKTERQSLCLAVNNGHDEADIVSDRGVVVSVMLSCVQAERDRVKNDEFVTKATVEKTSRDRSLVRLEDENAGLRQQLHTMQSQLAQVEHDHAHRSSLFTHSAYQRRSVA